MEAIKTNNYFGIVKTSLREKATKTKDRLSNHEVAVLSNPENIELMLSYVTGEKDKSEALSEIKQQLQTTYYKTEPTQLQTREIKTKLPDEIKELINKYIIKNISPLTFIDPETGVEDRTLKAGLIKILRNTNFGNKQDLVNGNQTLLQLLRDVMPAETQTIISQYQARKRLMPERFTPEHQQKLEYYQKQADILTKVVPQLTNQLN